MAQIAPAFHEADVWLYYAPVDEHPNALVDYDGLDPYWAISEFLLEEVDGGSLEIETTIEGEDATIRLTYSESGIMARPRDDPSGCLYEFDVNLQLAGERKVNYNLSPRFPEMRKEDGDTISTPWQHTDPDEGVSVHCQPTNLRLNEVPALLPRALQELFQSQDCSLYHGYFDRPFDGHISALERYVRIRREMNEKLIQSGGVMDRLANHLSGASRTKGMHKWDNERERGHHHVVIHSSTGASLLADHHRFGGQLKSYLPEHPEEFDPEDPLYHPKIATKFVAGRTATGAVDWSNRDELVRELDERLLSILSWAGIPTEPGGTTYVADDHFAADAAEISVALHRDPLPDLEAREDDILAAALADMTDSGEEILDAVATDGGQDVHTLAERADSSLSTVYRFLDRFEGVLESDNGHVQFCSQSIARRVRALLDDVQERVRSAAERVRDLVDLDAQQAASSAFDRWCAEYGVEFELPTDDGEPTLRIDTVLSRLKSHNAPHPEHVTREGLEAWKQDGRDVTRLRQALVEYRDPHGNAVTEVVGLLL